MIKISIVTLILIGQLVFVVALALVAYIYRFRKLSKLYTELATKEPELPAPIEQEMQADTAVSEVEPLDDLEKSADEQEVGDSESIENPIDFEAKWGEATKELETVRHKLEVTEQRIRNLGVFRRSYFELKSQLEDVIQLQRELSESFDNLELSDDVAGNWKLMISRLQEYNKNLESHLEQVTVQIETLGSETIAPDAQEETQGEVAQDLVQRQQTQIGKLIQLLADQEFESAKAAEIKESTDVIQQRADDLTIAVEVLQDENEFLQTQIQFLLQGQADKEKEYVAERDALQAELDRLTQEMEAVQEGGADTGELTDKVASLQAELDDLKQEHTELETEYLKLKNKLY